MKKIFLLSAALAGLVLTSCTDSDFVGDIDSKTSQELTDGAIRFSHNLQNTTRAGEFVGATAAEKLGGMFVVEGTKGTEMGSTTDATVPNSPSTTVVFDNYLVGYTANTAGTTESNTNNWEYVGKETGIPGKLSSTTWGALHSSVTAQTVKYWDYTQDQYDFIAWSTGEREAVTGDPETGTKVKVTRINTGSTLASNAFTMTALSAADLLQCYYTDINTVTKTSGNYGKPVTLTFRNMAAKVRVALYETVPGYSVKNVYFYTSDANPTSPTDLGYATTNTATAATLFTMGGVSLPRSGQVLVYYPHIGIAHRDATPRTKDYNKASVTVSDAGGATSPTQEFGTLTNQYVPAEASEGAHAVSSGGTTPDDYQSIVGSAAAGATLTAEEAAAYNAAISLYLGRTLPTATFAGDVTKDFYTAVIPNTNGVPLTLRVDYTLVSTDGSAEEIHVYGAKAVVPATYTVWQPNYAYTYVFKISDNSNGWTSTTNTDPKGLFPITFDAVVTKFVDANAEQATVTTVATPSITTYQQGHVHTLDPSTTKDEYSKSQTAGVSTDVKDVYVQVMDNSGSTPTLKSDLNGDNKSLLFKITKLDGNGDPADYVASEAEVMDALQNRTSEWNSGTPVTSPVGRNGITLTTKSNISNNVTSIINGVDDQPITQIDSDGDGDLENIDAGQVAKIDIDALDAGTYAYVYCTTVPSTNEKVYHVVSASEAETNYAKYYEVAKPANDATTLTSGTAAVDKVYFIKNLKADGTFDSYTFKPTKVGVDDVTGLVEGSIGANKASSYTAGNFYFDVYNQNNGAYAVKVIKVVE